MALVSKVLLSVAKRGLSSQIVLLPFKSQRLFCNEPSSSSNPLLRKLLQVPSSLIKTTLDSDDRFALKNPEFSWDSLVADLLSLSSEKAQLVKA